MSQHALLAPSSAPIWGHCSGSVIAQQSAANIDTQQSREGTAAHWVGSECLSAWQSSQLGDLTTAEWLGRVDPDGTVIDEKMVEGAQVYVDDVLKVAQQFSAISRLDIEHRVHMPQVHPENWGTLDASLVLLTHNVIYLWDYKHGHREVGAKANLQMIDYLVGVMQEHNIVGHREQQIDFVIRIVQPFCFSANGPVSEWRGKLSDLRSYVNQLTHQAIAAFADPRFTAGPHCRDCAIVGPGCATSRRYMYAWADYVNEPYVIDNMTAHDLATERNLLDGVLAVGKARKQAIEDELMHRIKAGKGVDSNLVIATAEGRLGWIKEIPVDQVLALCKQFGVDGQKDAAITPTQATKLVNADLRDAFKEVLKSFAKRPQGLTLIPAEESITSLAFKPK